MNFAQFWLLPSTCVLCQRAGQPQLDLCQQCESGFQPQPNPCPGCALPLRVTADQLRCGHCLKWRTRVHRTVALGAYASPISELITQFKYHRKLEAGRVLASRLAVELGRHYHGDQWPDLLIPIPLHPARIRQRGYNQAVLLANDLGGTLRIPVAADAVRRHLATPAQQGLSAHERRRNLRGAFAINTPWQHKFARRIALVDDVVTTMSTVTEVARELQRHLNPAPEIHVWCLARA